MTFYHLESGKLYWFKKGFNKQTQYDSPKDNQPFVVLESASRRGVSIFNSIKILFGKEIFQIYLADEEYFLIERLPDNEKE